MDDSVLKKRRRIVVRANRDRAARFVQPSAAQSWTLDATSNEATPLTEAEAEALLSAGGVASPNVTSLYKFGTPASGNIADTGAAGKTLTVPGGDNWAYQQAVTGWSILSLKSTANTACNAYNATFANVNANSYVVFLLARVTAVSAVNRTLFRFGDTFGDDATVEIDDAAHVRVGEGDGTYTTGTADPLNVAHWYVLRINDTGNTVDAFTDQEKLIGGTQACNGTELRFGGDNVQTWMPPTADYMLAFVHTGTMTNTEIKNTLVAAGKTVPWSP